MIYKSPKICLEPTGQTVDSRWNQNPSSNKAVAAAGLQHATPNGCLNYYFFCPECAAFEMPDQFWMRVLQCCSNGSRRALHLGPTLAAWGHFLLSTEFHMVPHQGELYQRRRCQHVKTEATAAWLDLLKLCIRLLACNCAHKWKHAQNLCFFFSSLKHPFVNI